MTSKYLLNSLSHLSKYKIAKMAELKATQNKLNKLMGYVADQDIHLQVFKNELDNEADIFKKAQQQKRIKFEIKQQTELDNFLRWQANVEDCCKELETHARKLERKLEKLE